MADTDIELSVKLDTKDISSSARELRKEIKNMFDASAGKQLDTQLQSTMAKMAKLSSQSRQTAKEMQALENVKVPTQEFKDASNRVDLLSKALEKARDKYASLAKANGPKEKINDAREAVLYYQQQLEQAEGEMQKLVNQGKAFTLGSASQDYANLAAKQRDIYNQMIITTTKARELEPSFRSAEQPISQTDKLAKDLKGTMADIVTSAKQLGSTTFGKLKSIFAALTKNIKGTQKASSGLGGAFKKLIKYGLGITTLVMLFRKIRQAIGEGIKNLAQWNNGNNKTNKALSTLMSSLAQLKNALGAAFAPILQAIAPALNTLIQLCISAANAIGMMMAKLTGSNTFVKATKVQKDFAKSLKGTGGAAKNATTSIDELNIVSKESGGGAADNPNQMFEEVAVDKASSKLADFFEPFKNSWDKYGQSVMDAWEYALDSVLNLASDIGDSFMEVWTNGSGEELLNHWMVILMDIGLIIGNLANQFDEAWKKNEIGTQIFQSIFDILNLIWGTIEECATATVAWSSSLDFYPLLEGVHNLLEGIKAALKPIMEVLKFIYTEIVLPMIKWIIESGLPAVLDLIGAALETIGQVCTEVVWPILKTMFDALRPVTEQLGQTLIEMLDEITQLLKDLSPTISDVGDIVKKYIIPIIKTMNTWLSDYLVWSIKLVGTTFKNIVTSIRGQIDALKTFFRGLITFLTGVFTGDWTKAWNGIKDIFKGVWNGIATLCETVVNNIIDLINSISFDVPDWVPTIGGTHFGFDIQKITIPKLAEGAVIPPNKEFMAVLGDQKQGTNIEAPLTTIQDAVATVLEPYLQQLINITEDIYNKDTSVNIGDREIAQAAIRGQRGLGLQLRRT